MKATLTFAFALLLICTGTGAALAQTPDGQPPSSEDVCDAETGSAYGHCNAYCEAMDCHLANDGDPTTEPSASANACSKVRSKFQQTTGRDLPCEVPPVVCPCLDDPTALTFAQVVAGDLTIASCSLGNVGPGVGVMLRGPGSSILAFSVVRPFGSGPACAGDQAGPPITPEQHQECSRLLEQAAASQGVPCVPVG